MMDLSDKASIVTGAANGIGSAVAENSSGASRK